MHGQDGVLWQVLQYGCDDDHLCERALMHRIGTRKW